MKVTVIVPTYSSPRDELAELVASLDAQTLHTSEYEVLFVDDGSPDDTLAVLRTIQAEHPNFRVHRIENSGWPSRPRNIGIDMARGEYVLFMDHDDRLYPDALRAGYEFARANQADVLNGKEAYTNTAHWALGAYTEDQGQSIGRRDTHPLQPMNPHKLYRTEFLREHGIRFPEGRKVLWEDQFFNVKVARHAEVISTLSSVPFYHWVHTKGSGSTLFIKAADDYWHWFNLLLESIRDELAGDDHEWQREFLLESQYNARVLGLFDAGFVRRPAEHQEFLFEHTRAVRERFGMERFDQNLSVSRQARAFALAQNDLELMLRLCVEDVDVSPSADAVELSWQDGVLRLTSVVEWRSASGLPLPLVREGDRIVKGWPEDLREAFPEGMLDVTSELNDAKVDLSVRSRTSRIVWLAEGETEIEIVDTDAGPVFRATNTSTIDPRDAAMGDSLDSTYWDVFSRVRLGHWMTHRATRSAFATTVSLVGGRLHLIYTNDGGAATLIPEGQVEAVRRLVPTAAAEDPTAGVVIELSGDHDGFGDIGTKVAVAWHSDSAWVDAPAQLAVEGGRARLELGKVALPLRVRVGDRTGDRTSSWIIYRNGGSLALAPGLPPSK